MFSGGFGGFGGIPGFSFGGGMEEESEGQEKKEVNTTHFYEVLEIEKTATTDQIKKAFRKKAMKEHPDKGGDPEKFKQISSAYEVLSNPEKRALYDEYGEEGVQNGGPPSRGMGGIFDLFDMFGGRGKKQSGPKKAKPKLIEMEVTLQEVYEGIVKNLKIKRLRNCETCDGKGGANVKKCTKCDGKGVNMKLVQIGPGTYSQSQERCKQCKGEGQIMKEADRCKGCEGKKALEKERTVEISIERGCPDQKDYILIEEGDEYPGIVAGDIYVRIKIKSHLEFVRKGADIFINKKISLLEALTGFKVDIKHLDGKNHTIATAPHEILNNKTTKTVKGLGMPFYKHAMCYGNLHVKFNIEFPKKNALSKDKIEKLAQILKTNVPVQPPNTKVLLLQPFNENDLNRNPMGGAHQEEEEGGHRQMRCESQ